VDQRQAGLEQVLVALRAQLAEHARSDIGSHGGIAI
jgi:hypothetical protein